MGTFIDAIMVILFVLFMVFIQRGYHRNKVKEREEREQLDKKESSKKS